MRTALFALTLLTSVFQLSAQDEQAPPRSVPSILESMKSQDFSKRSRAFDEAAEMMASDKLTPADTDRLKLGIIQLLAAENTRINVPDGERVKPATAATGCGNGTDNCEGAGDGDESDYYPSLISTVAAFNDERAIPALVGATPFGGDATRALSKFGDKAVGPILDQLKSRNALLRTSALSLAITLEGRSALVSPTRIKEMLRSALTDPVAVVRSHAVNEIACLDDRQDFVPTLEKLATTDPEHWKGREDDGVDGDQFYPVRFDARRALREIKNNERCVWR